MKVGFGVQEMLSRITLVRDFLSKACVDAVILRHGDEYFSEEVSPHHQVFNWLTGLDVSYGYIVITKDVAVLFVDGRYILAAQETLERDVWTIINVKQASPVRWIKDNISGALALDPKFHTINETENLVKAGVKTVFFEDLINSFWKDRRGVKGSKLFKHPIKYAGESSLSKLSRISDHLTKQNVDAILVSDPCDVAWTVNMRGNGLKYTPVAPARMIAFKDGNYKIYTDSVPDEPSDKVRPYAQILPDITAFKGKILLDPNNTPYAIKAKIKAEAIYDRCMIQNFKSIKNKTELDGASKAQILDGVAVASLLSWLHKKIGTDKGVFEGDVSEKITHLRAKSDLYLCESFSCIAAFGKNAANVHYRVKGQGERLSNSGLFLLDTGGQYWCGTTDVTRTMCFGQPTLEEQEVYTRVLKGHIALSSAVFPIGTTGYQLDCLARQYLWQAGLDYDHGTGHGIGSCLSVHEGPGNFSKKSSSDYALCEDTLITIEPGCYLKDRLGIRIENVNKVVKLATEIEKEGRLTFATLTPVLMDFKLIMPFLLTEQEKIWLKNYHEWVLKIIAPCLDEDDKYWLVEQTSPYFNVL
jgi:Xaa-Pro aminopeptidase